jgi:hypothetical protein
MALNDAGIHLDIRLRSVRDEDWPVILAVANRSVAGVPGAGTQEEWESNRRRFDATRGFREHFVAEITDQAEVVGYGAVESMSTGERDELRMFIVTPPERLSVVGELLYRSAMTVLARARVRRVRLTEYAGDQPLRAFAEARGFSEQHRFQIADGNEVIVLVKDLERPPAGP